jgi:SNF2 family DNA or RNA helicase
MKRIISHVRSDLSAKRTAFPYQVQAFLTIKDLAYSAIFHEQGLGKTKIAIDLLLYWLSKKDVDTVMIVTKKQLVKNWVDEFGVHTHIVPRILSSNRGSNFYVLNSPAKVIVTNFETISTEKERVSLFLKCRNVAIIIDESTKLKNPDAKITQDFFALSDLFKYKTIMTGTPVANRPYDIWAQVFFLDHGNSLGTDFVEFKRQTDLSNKLSTDQKCRNEFEDVLSSIYRKIRHFSVRETKASCKIDLPQKTYQTVFSHFERKQRIMYETVLHDLEIEVKQDAHMVLDDDSVALKRLLRLMQIASNPALIDSSYKGTPGKKIQLERLLQSICSAGDKCIVWSCFIENVNAFAQDFANFNPRKIHGAMSIEDRNKSVDLFKRDDGCKVLFATPQAAKEGLTLTVANHVIFYDRGFNLDDYLQAQDRIHRISQTKPCFVYNIMMHDSVDIWIDRLIEAKHHAALLAQGDIPLSEYKKTADYSYGDLIRKILQPEET